MCPQFFYFQISTSKEETFIQQLNRKPHQGACGLRWYKGVFANSLSSLVRNQCHHAAVCILSAPVINMSKYGKILSHLSEVNSANHVQLNLDVTTSSSCLTAQFNCALYSNNKGLRYLIDYNYRNKRQCDGQELLGLMHLNLTHFDVQMSNCFTQPQITHFLVYSESFLESTVQLSKIR